MIADNIEPEDWPRTRNALELLKAETRQQREELEAKLLKPMTKEEYEDWQKFTNCSDEIPFDEVTIRVPKGL